MKEVILLFIFSRTLKRTRFGCLADKEKKQEGGKEGSGKLPKAEQGQGKRL